DVLAPLTPPVDALVAGHGLTHHIVVDASVPLEPVLGEAGGPLLGPLLPQDAVGYRPGEGAEDPLGGDLHAVDHEGRRVHDLLEGVDGAASHAHALEEAGEE